MVKNLPGSCHVVNAEQHRVSADLWIKPVDLGHKSASMDNCIVYVRYRHDADCHQLGQY